MEDILSELNGMFEEAIEVADKQTIGQKLEEKRNSLNLKLVDIARITGLSESLIGKIESDKLDDIKISTMKKLSIAYGIPAEVFITHMGLNEELSEIPKKTSELINARNLLLKK